MSENNVTKIRKSHYNPDRPHYLTEDGRFYVYEHWDDEKKCIVRDEYEIGKDISLEMTIILDNEDWEMDNADRKENDQRDPLFDAKVSTYYANQDADDAVNPWDLIPDQNSNPENILLAEPKLEDPTVEKVRKLIDESCTEAQQDLFWKHYGMGIQLEEIRHEEIQATGKSITNAAMTNRVNKIINKAAKALGAERIKRHKYPGQE